MRVKLAPNLADQRQTIKTFLASVQNFPQRLADAIRRSGKKKGALAEHCGVALSTVSRWLGGSEPSADHVNAIAGFLGVDAKWLLFGERSGEMPFAPAALREAEAVYRSGPVADLTLEQRMDRMENLLMMLAEQNAGTAELIRRVLTKR